MTDPHSLLLCALPLACLLLPQVAYSLDYLEFLGACTEQSMPQSLLPHRLCTLGLLESWGRLRLRTLQLHLNLFGLIRDHHYNYFSLITIFLDFAGNIITILARAPNPLHCHVFPHSISSTYHLNLVTTWPPRVKLSLVLL